jgi:hypothetical protein
VAAALAVCIGVRSAYEHEQANVLAEAMPAASVRSVWLAGLPLQIGVKRHMSWWDVLLARGVKRRCDNGCVRSCRLMCSQCLTLSLVKLLPSEKLLSGTKVCIDEDAKLLMDMMVWHKPCFTNMHRSWVQPHRPPS